jgi:hypothetical protein
MRLLRFNGENVDIDEKTAIGIDFQGYNVKDPGKRKVSVSNTFTIPATSNNMRLIGYAGNPQSLSTTVYNLITVNYYNENKTLIRNGRARITEVGERISVFVFEKDNFWELMADFLWPDFLTEFLTWMQAEKGLPSATSPFVGTLQQFVDAYSVTTEGIFLPLYIGNLSKYDVGGSFIEDDTTLWLKHHNTGDTITALGGHFSIYCKTIFEFIEYKYGVNLSVTSTEYDYNIFEDVIASAMYVPARNLSIEFTPTGFYFQTDFDGQFLPEKNSNEKDSKSLYDFTKWFFQRFNCLIDKIKTTDNTEKYIIHRFDDIIHAPVIDFSEGITGKYVFKPIIEGYKQTNYIKFSAVYEGGSEILNAKKITCLNKNIDAGGADSDLFTIDEYIPAQFAIGGDVCPDLSTSDSFKSFEGFISQGSASIAIKARENSVDRTATSILSIARTYDLNSEYNTLDLMAQYPKVYNIKKWLTLNTIDKIVYFARYWVRDLNGYYFINKISGYNPDKSTVATDIELIKIPQGD